MFEPFYITGMGVVSAYGGGNSIFKDNINKFASGIKPLTLFSEASYEKITAGEIANFNPGAVLGERGLRGYSRVTLMIMECLHHLIKDYKLKNSDAWAEPFKSEDVSLIIGTLGSIKSDSEIDFQAIKNPRHMVPSEFPGALACVPAGYAAIKYKIQGSTITLSQGETSSLDALAFAGNNLKTKRAKLVISGGAEELTLQYALILQGRSQRESLQIPILGEGSVMFSCEHEDTMLQRDSKALAQVLGYSSCFNPDYFQGFTVNINSLKRIMGENVLSSVDFIFPSGKGNEERTVIAGEKILISPLLGSVNSATGAFKLAAALMMDTIPEGSIILINDTSSEGLHSSMIIQKKSQYE